jgi:hypothetical protein
MLNKLEKKMDIKTKKELNRKLAMADELLEILNNDIKNTKTRLEFCHDSFTWHEEKHLRQVEFFRNILTCKDQEEYHDLTSGWINTDKLNTIK